MEKKNIDNLLLRIGTYDFTTLAHHSRHSGRSLLVRSLCSRQPATEVQFWTDFHGTASSDCYRNSSRDKIIKS